MDTAHISRRSAKRLAHRLRSSVKFAALTLLIWLTSHEASANTQAMLQAMLAANSTCRSLDFSGTLPNGLLGYWRLDEPAGSTSAVDSSSVPGTPASISSGVSMGTTARVKTGAAFNGASSISIPHHATYKPAFPFTISLWFKVSDLNPPRPVNLFSTDRYDDNYYYGATIGFETSGTIVAHIGNGGSSGSSARHTKQSTVIVQAGVWYHVAVAFINAGSFKIYVNGALKNQAGMSGFASNMVTSSAPSRIGGASVGRSLNGIIDEVSIWNYELGSSEIRTLYENQACGRN